MPLPNEAAWADYDLPPELRSTRTHARRVKCGPPQPLKEATRPRKKPFHSGVGPDRDPNL